VVQIPRNQILQHLNCTSGSSSTLMVSKIVDGACVQGLQDDFHPERSS
jgi:hypothetical protein